MTEVYYYILPQWAEEWEKNFLGDFIPQKTDKLYQKKRCSNYGRLIARNACAKRIGMASNLPEIAVDDFGKPYFKDLSGAHFNITHSNLLVAVAFSDMPVGIDAEYIRKYNGSVAERFFTTAEREKIKTNRDFFSIWTKKEAYIKCQGKGFKIPLNSFDATKAEQSSNYSVFEVENYIISVYIERKNEEIKLIKLSDKEIREYMV